jgi:hypothetical protein
VFADFGASALRSFSSAFPTESLGVSALANLTKPIAFGHTNPFETGGRQG